MANYEAKKKEPIRWSQKFDDFLRDGLIEKNMSFPI